MLTATNVSCVGIIYPQSNPSTVFLEIKDDGHPIPLFRRGLCLIGGNWIGELAKPDGGPADTFCREIGEELSFDRPMDDMIELAELGLAARELRTPPPGPSMPVAEADQQLLSRLKSAITARCEPLGMTLNHITRAALERADPKNQRDGFASVSCYFRVPLDVEEWEDLVRLQTRHRNLSNESISLITTAEEILAHGRTFIGSHDFMLDRFWHECGILPRTAQLPRVEGTSSELLGAHVPETYDELLREWNILKRPEGR